MGSNSGLLVFLDGLVVNGGTGSQDAGLWGPALESVLSACASEADFSLLIFVGTHRGESCLLSEMISLQRKVIESRFIGGSSHSSTD